jgi:hypothetical protein
MSTQSEIMRQSPSQGTPLKEQQEEIKLEDVKTLSRNGLREICNNAPDVKQKYYIIQAVDVKVFTEQD